MPGWACLGASLLQEPSGPGSSHRENCVAIKRFLPPQRHQTLLFSATFPRCGRLDSLALGALLSGMHGFRLPCWACGGGLVRSLPALRITASVSPKTNMVRRFAKTRELFRSCPHKLESSSFRTPASFTLAFGRVRCSLRWCFTRHWFGKLSLRRIIINLHSVMFF